MSTMKYKATERYSVGWTDPRVFRQLDVAVDFGVYRLIIFGQSPDMFDISFIPPEGDPAYARVKQSEFAAYIEAFLQEKKGEHTNGGL